MNVLLEIERRKAAHVAACGDRVKPTIYAGRNQMDELKAAMAAFPGVRCKGVLGDPQVFGMPLIAVELEDYLRVA